ncbi:Lrp/AsnC family transcriptional regulator [Agaribacter flavus]|uniref:Lrp/AsnC family transcriptional regulator n=1 Tax=Agaribacter flavus TaxID=1902781 RepID=A0ABV7FTZ5_9ALTE
MPKKSNASSRTILDNTDRELIALLKRDARAPVSVLAEVLQVSRATVQNRINKLIDSGALLGFTIRVKEELSPNTIRAIMLVEVAGKSTSQVIQRLRRIPELDKIHTTNGNWDLVIELSATDLQAFDRVLRDVRETDAILNSETSILLSSV